MKICEYSPNIQPPFVLHLFHVVLSWWYFVTRSQSFTLKNKLWCWDRVLKDFYKKQEKKL